MDFAKCHLRLVVLSLLALEPLVEHIHADCAARGIRIVADEIYHGISYIGPVRSALSVAPEQGEVPFELQRRLGRQFVQRQHGAVGHADH